jgi:hypothetical protein
MHEMKTERKIPTGINSFKSIHTGNDTNPHQNWRLLPTPTGIGNDETMKYEMR